jgi:hypothetical protein
MKQSLIIILLVYLVGSFGFSAYIHYNWFFLSDEAATTFWMTMNAAVKTLAFFAVYKSSKRTERVIRSVSFVLFTLSLNDLLDELFFNPCAFQVNELLLIIILAWHVTNSFYVRKN